MTDAGVAIETGLPRAREAQSQRPQQEATLNTPDANQVNKFSKWWNDTFRRHHEEQARESQQGAILNQDLQEEGQTKARVKVQELAVGGIDVKDYSKFFVLSEETEIRKFLNENKEEGIPLTGEQVDSALITAANFTWLIKHLDEDIMDKPDTNVFSLYQSKKDVIPQLYGILAHPNYLQNAGITDVALDITKSDMDVLARDPNDLDSLSGDLRLNTVKRELMTKLIRKLPKFGVSIIPAAMDETVATVLERKMSAADAIRKAALETPRSKVLTLLPDVDTIKETGAPTIIGQLKQFQAPPPPPKEVSGGGGSEDDKKDSEDNSVQAPVREPRFVIDGIVDFFKRRSREKAIKEGGTDETKDAAPKDDESKDSNKSVESEPKESAVRKTLENTAGGIVLTAKILGIGLELAAKGLGKQGKKALRKMFRMDMVERQARQEELEAQLRKTNPADYLTGKKDFPFVEMVRQNIDNMSQMQSVLRRKRSEEIPDKARILYNQSTPEFVELDSVVGDCSGEKIRWDTDDDADYRFNIASDVKNHITAATSISAASFQDLLVHEVDGKYYLPVGVDKVAALKALGIRFVPMQVKHYQPQGNS